MNNRILVDTGFWIALFDRGDEHHENAGNRADWLDLAIVVVPWPTLYETLRTRFVRRPDWVVRLDRQLKQTNVEFIDDRDYCDEAYSLAVEYSTFRRRDISMVDMLCRLLIADPNTSINYLLTTNPKDFVDVCTAHDVELL